MVFFTCNHCGESLKKNAVDKHYNHRSCRNNRKSVSCMDCLKDFYGEEYCTHTSCVSELQKYSGKNFVPKEEKNNSQKKQETWTNVIGSILDNKEYSLSNRTRQAFTRLQGLENVPRKKGKFQNFVANCVKMSSELSEEVWSILEKEQAKLKTNTAELKQEKILNVDQVTDVTTATVSPIKDPAGDSSEIVQKTIKSKSDVDCNNKKKKKEKHSKKELDVVKLNKETDSEGAKEIIGEESFSNGDFKKKSKKAKRVLEIENENQTDLQTVKTIIPNDEPKQKKRKKSEECSKVIENKVVNGDGNSSGKLEKNTKKTKALQEPKVETSQNDASEKNESETYTEAGYKAAEDNCIPFNWNEAIEQIVTNYSEGVKLNKLRKKLFKIYAAQLPTIEITTKIEKKFGRKFEKNLQNCTKVHLENEIVKSL